MKGKKPNTILTTPMLIVLMMGLLIVGLGVWLGVWLFFSLGWEPLEPLGPPTQSESIAQIISMLAGALAGAVYYRKLRSWSRGDRFRFSLYIGAAITALVLPLTDLSSSGSWTKLVLMLGMAWFSAWFFPRYLVFLLKFDPRNKKKPPYDSSSD